MKDILLIAQIVISILLILSILMQNRGVGLGSAFGGGASDSNFYSSKRGVEKILSRFTIIVAFLFVANAALIMFL